MIPLSFFLFFLLHIQHLVLSCNKSDRDSLISFYQNLSPNLNWSSPNCCTWQGISCHKDRVTRLSLPGNALSGTITPLAIANLSFLSYLNLSRNHLSGHLPLFPSSIRYLDLSSNLFNGSIDHPLFFPNLIVFNVSNNSFTGPLPIRICSSSSRLLQILDFSSNKFSGHILDGIIGGCSNLQVFRAGFNSLSGGLPSDIYTLKTLTHISLPNNNLSGTINNSIALLTNLTILELHVNGFTGHIPPDIGFLTNLEQLQLHTNNLTGTLPPSLADCSSLKTLLLRNNHIRGQISTLDFSKLASLEAVDFGNNSLSGYIPASLCLCRSLTALRFAYNMLVGKLPPCMASMKSLAHLSLSDNYLSDVVGALKILRHCDNLQVLFLSRCFSDEMMPDDDDLLHLNGFQNLQILTLGGCNLKGQIPSWIGKLRKVKVLNLSYNQIWGRIPSWLGNMPSLLVLNLTQNLLSGNLPPEIGGLPALITDNSSSDLSSLALPFLFDSLQYNRLFNLPRGVKVGNNRLSGNIPAELGQLKLVHIVELSNNNFNGSIPDQLSGLVNVEKLDMSGNHLTGEIPRSLTELSFLSSFSVANNDLQGEIPRAGQFDTFPASSFQGNPKLCGYILERSCSKQDDQVATTKEEEDDDDEEESSWFGFLPFGMGYFVGFFAVSIITLLRHPSFCVYPQSRPALSNSNVV